MTCRALAICFAFLQLALVCASLLSRVEEHGDVNSCLPGYNCVSLQQGLTHTLVLCEQSSYVDMTLVNIGRTWP